VMLVELRIKTDNTIDPLKIIIIYVRPVQNRTELVMQSTGAYMRVICVFLGAESSEGKSARRTSRKLALFIRDFLDRQRAHNRYRSLQWMLLARRWGKGLWGEHEGGGGNDGGVGGGRKKGARRGCGSTRSTHSRSDEKAASNRRREKRRELL